MGTELPSAPPGAEQDARQAKEDIHMAVRLQQLRDQGCLIMEGVFQGHKRGGFTWARALGSLLWKSKSRAVVD